MADPKRPSIPANDDGPDDDGRDLFGTPPLRDDEKEAA